MGLRLRVGPGAPVTLDERTALRARVWRRAFDAGAVASVKGSRGVQPGAGMSAAALRECVEVEIEQCRRDADIRATQDTRNQLEAFIYSCRSALEDALR